MTLKVCNCFAHAHLILKIVGLQTEHLFYRPNLTLVSQSCHVDTCVGRLRKTVSDNFVRHTSYRILGTFVWHVLQSCSTRVLWRHPTQISLFAVFTEFWFLTFSVKPVNTLRRKWKFGYFLPFSPKKSSPWCYNWRGMVRTNSWVVHTTICCPKGYFCDLEWK